MDQLLGYIVAARHQIPKTDITVAATVIEKLQIFWPYGGIGKFSHQEVDEWRSTAVAENLKNLPLPNYLSPPIDIDNTSELMPLQIRTL